MVTVRLRGGANWLFIHWRSIYSRSIGERRNFNRINRIILEWQGMDSFQWSIEQP